MNPQESDNFDFEGCLALCRGLWSAATQAATTDADRQAARGVVMQTWKGRFATETTASMRTASTNAAGSEAGIRTEARAWAQIWSQEWLREANIRYQTAANTAESHKSVWDKMGDWVTGDSTYADHPAPKAPEVPQPPGFASTAPLPTYDFG